MSDVHRRFLLDGVHHSRRKSARKREFAARANQNLSTPGCDQQGKRPLGRFLSEWEKVIPV